MKKLFCICTLTFIVTFSVIFICKELHNAYDVAPVSREQLERIDTSRASCLMIVAHPDDETLWGGAHLSSDDYFVVCLTNSSNKKRNSEFQNAMKISNDQFLILDYPDKVMGKRSNWKKVKKQIADDIEKIISLKKWKLIVTHNPDGEYGHIHHKMTNEIVTGVYNKKSADYPLYYFGKYYDASQKNMLEELTPEDGIQAEKKNEMLNCYSSQKSVVKKFGHMCAYEQWTKYIQR